MLRSSFHGITGASGTPEAQAQEGVSVEEEPGREGDHVDAQSSSSMTELEHVLFLLSHEKDPEVLQDVLDAVLDQVLFSLPLSAPLPLLRTHENTM